MAEIRKYDPQAGNAIAQALRAAMGDPVRPNEPGAPSRQAPTPPTAQPSVVTFTVNTSTDEAPADPDD